LAGLDDGSLLGRDKKPEKHGFWSGETCDSKTEKRKKKQKRKEVKDQDDTRGKQSPSRNNGSGEGRAADPICQFVVKDV